MRHHQPEAAAGGGRGAGRGDVCRGRGRSRAGAACQGKIADPVLASLKISGSFANGDVFFFGIVCGIFSGELGTCETPRGEGVRP